MPHRMKPTLRLLAVGLALSALAGACTGGGSKDGAASPSRSPASATPTVSVTGPPGSTTYHYANTGLTATIQFEGDTGTLTVQNETGHELPAPGFYILDARDGKRIQGSVDAAAPVPNGRTSTFDVSFSGLEEKNVGLVVLLMGADNYGAFVRQ